MLDPRQRDTTPTGYSVSMVLDAWHYDNHVETAPILIAFNASNTIPALLSPTVPGLDVGSHWGCRFRQCQSEDD